MAFYRQYRPQKFADLVGQEHIKKTLTNALRQGKVSHAYLFSGPRGIGKTTAARLLAKALNCQKRVENGELGAEGTLNSQLSTLNSEPCNQCLSCQEISQDKSLDVIEIDAASTRGIDEIRELREKIKFAPSGSPYKVFIIDEVHMLTKEAFNALLKTLEEPPKHAIFILATTELHKIPATILSRTQQFDFKRAGLENILSYLQRIMAAEKIKIEPQALRLIAASGEGSYRDAASILDQVASLGAEKISLQDVQEVLGLTEEETIIQFLQFLAQSNGRAGLDLLNQLLLDGYDLIEFNRRLVDFLRRILIFQTNSDLLAKAELTEEQKESVRELSKSFEREKILSMIRLFIESEKEIKYSTLPQLPLELAVMEICEADKGDKKIRRYEGKALSSYPPKSQSIDALTLKDKWSQILQEIESTNHSLYLLLKESEPLKIEHDKLFLAVKFKFYAERIEDKKNYNLLNQVMEKVLGASYPLEYVIGQENLPKQKDSSSGDLEESVLEVFEEE